MENKGIKKEAVPKIDIKTNNTPNNMDSDEIYLIKKTWDVPMADPEGVGGTILIEFFTCYPHNLLKFTKLKDVSATELITSPRFKMHATKIMQIFDESIQSLGYDWSENRLQEIWVALADSHFKRKISRKSYNEIKECILHVLGQACKLDEEQAETWSKLLDVIYAILFKRYSELEALKN